MSSPTPANNNNKLEEQEQEDPKMQGEDETPSPRHENRTHSAAIELVYDRLITSLSTDVAFQIHRMIKTGVYPLSDLLTPEDRSELYPDIYGRKEDDKNNGNVKDPETELKKYAVFYPEPRKRRRLEDAAKKSPVDTANTTTDQAAGQQQQQSSGGTQAPPPAAAHLDIYGKMPAKEPAQMVPCTVCGRQVNTLRYAPHLDKCLGIGTTVRQAALAASGFVPSRGTTK